MFEGCVLTGLPLAAPATPGKKVTRDCLLSEKLRKRKFAHLGDSPAESRFYCYRPTHPALLPLHDCVRHRMGG